MYPIDELANLVAMANTNEQLALTEDIRLNGQQEPAVLWQGRIVDGRCRQLACTTLDIPLMTRELDSKLTREEVALVVKSLNTRRNLTDMQKAMSAYKQQEKTGEANEKIAKQWGVSFGTYKNAKYIGDHRPDLIDPLFNGKSIKILDPDKGFEVTTNKINTLARIIKRAEEKKVIVVDDSEKIQFTVDGNVKTEDGKNWYYATVDRIKHSPEPMITMQLLLVELANLKFSLKGNND